MLQGQDQALQARDLAFQLKMNDFYLDDFLFLQMQDKLMLLFLITTIGFYIIIVCIKVLKMNITFLITMIY